MTRLTSDRTKAQLKLKPLIFKLKRTSATSWPVRVVACFRRTSISTPGRWVAEALPAVPLKCTQKKNTREEELTRGYSDCLPVGENGGRRAADLRSTLVVLSSIKHRLLSVWRPCQCAFERPGWVRLQQPSDQLEIPSQLPWSNYILLQWSIYLYLSIYLPMVLNG